MGQRIPGSDNIVDDIVSGCGVLFVIMLVAVALIGIVIIGNGYGCLFVGGCS